MTERLSHAPAGGLDQPFHAAIAPAYTDWLQLLALSPDKQLALFVQGMCNRQTLFALGTAALGAAAPPTVEPLPQGKRFAAPAWQRWPFNVYRESYAPGTDVFEP